MLDYVFLRSAAEISFRVRQEARNAWHAVRPPGLRAQPGGARAAAFLPDPAPVVKALRGTAFAGEVESLADCILQHRFPLLGYVIETGTGIRWRRDYVHGKESDAVYFRRVPYLDFERSGDHKIVWELNRHQHLVVLAQAFRLTGRAAFFDEIIRQLESWLEQNPYMRGINWASALEVAFRALSWIWVFHLAGGRMEPGFRARFLKALWLHGRYLEGNFSTYFSPNTHLLGEAVALHALGVFLAGFPRAGEWTKLGSQAAGAQMDSQVREDGSHFEQSTYYHVYALDFFLFDALLAPRPEPFRGKLARMAEYLAAVMGPSGLLPLVGDDDGGRVFHPYGPRERFGRATLATAGLMLSRPDLWPAEDDVWPQAAWWLGAGALDMPRGSRPAPCSRLFPCAGLAVMHGGGMQVLVDAGPFGPGNAGHSHSDTLSLIARRGGDELLIDPGTYTYVGDAAAREWFRGSSAHNTIAVNGASQAAPAGPFRWKGKPEVERKNWIVRDGLVFLDASCRYARFTHRRKVLLLPSGVLMVLDEVAGPPEPVTVEQFWHPGELGDAVLYLAGGEEATFSGWRSRVYGAKEPAPAIRATRRGPPPARLGMLLSPAPVEGAGRLELRETGAGIAFVLGGRVQALFPAEGLPR